MPTPTTKGGQASAPAFLTTSTIQSVISCCAGCRLEHFECAFIFAAAAFGHKGYFQFIAGHNRPVNNGRRVIARIFAVLHRLTNDAFTQETFFVALRDASVNRIDSGFTCGTLDNNFCPLLDENNRKTCILAKRKPLRRSDTGIFN